MLSLIRACRFPMLMLVTMRGEWEEFNPWQVPMGSIVEPTLKLCDTHVAKVETPEAGGAGGAERAAACVRRRPRRGGAAVAEADRPQGVGEVMLERRAAMATLAGRPAEESVRRAGARLLHLGRVRRRRRRPQFLSLGRDGRRGDDRARPGAGEAEPARRRHHRRRRDADGHGQPRHHRRAEAEKPRHRRVRQRPLRRDRPAGEPHQQRRRSARGGARLRHRRA